MKALFLFSFVALCAAASVVNGQFLLQSTGVDKEALLKSEARRYTSLMNALNKPSSDPNIDAKYYKLNLSINTVSQYLRGVVTVKALSTIANLASVTLDLMSAMTADSVKAGSTKLSYVQHSSTLTITLDRSYSNGEPVTMDIYYRGYPGISGSGSFAFSSHAGTPWVWTLSEPYGARDWWPCKDHPLDKADSVDIWVTVDEGFKVGSNGKLVEVVNNGNGTHTYRWAERYPISTYLVSLAITNYADFTNWFKYTATDSMPVLNYVLPEDLSSAQANLPRTVDMLRIYSDKFGLYPFINEKYGHSEFGWAGGMEHQTMTSLGGFDEGLVAHELAHMWFGDMITCANWSNIWMNEGFATYCVAAYAEEEYGTSDYWAYMKNQMISARNAGGSIYVRDTSNLNILFNNNLVYAKGATVLHMLRHVLGDSIFFTSLRAYASDTRFRFGVASTEDFRQVCENVSGKSLGYFFNEWIYGESYPSYACKWKAQPGLSGFDVTLQFDQTTGTTNPPFFTMPIDCRLAAAGWDTTVAIFNSSNGEQFVLKTSHKPDTVQLDPQNWILRDALSIPLDKAVLSVNTQTMDLGTIDVNVPRRDNTFIVTNMGGASDSVYVTLDYVNVTPESAVSISPIAFALPGGASQTMTFSIQPRLLASNSYYNTVVIIDSRFGYGTAHFEKTFKFEISGTLVVQDGARVLPKEFALLQNSPNPFNPSTTIRYELPKASHVLLKVFNTLGQEVATLVDAMEEPGYKSAQFDGSSVSSGVYFYHLHAGNFEATKKLLLLR